MVISGRSTAGVSWIGKASRDNKPNSMINKAMTNPAVGLPSTNLVGLITDTHTFAST